MKKTYCISGDEKVLFEDWLARYKEWKNKEEKIDPVTARRHREAFLILARF